MSLALVLLVLVVCFPFQSSAQEDEVITTESVQVVNVEVPVRVFFKGSPVDGLTKSSFKIFENGKPQKINGFYVRKKKLVETEVPADVIEQKTIMNSRYFVLVFKITNYNDALHKGLEYLFKNVLQESDQCMVFINDKTIFFKNFTNKENARAVLNKVLREESHQARQRMEKYLMKVEDELKTFRIRAAITTSGVYGEFSIEVLRLLKKYLWIWQDYNHTYLQPHLDNYYYFSRHLEKIKKEKWVINFYQIEMFPKLKHSGPIMEEIRNMLGSLLSYGDAEQTTMGKAISKLFQDIDLELHTTKNFPADEISKLFFKVDATFHSILIPVNRQLLSKDLEYRKISSEIENSLREITKRTGGILQKTGNLESALGNIEKKEDITYMLTYSPDNPEKVGKIRVKVDNKKFKILYDDQMRVDYIKEYLRKKKMEFPDIQILNTNFRNKVLSIDVKDFLMSKQNKHIQKGKIYFEIEILDSSNKTLYDQKKTIIAEKDHISIAVNFPWMRKGRYNLIVQVTDIQTGKTSSDFLQPIIH